MTMTRLRVALLPGLGKWRLQSAGNLIAPLLSFYAESDAWSRGASRAPVASGGRDIVGNWFAHLQKPCSVSPIQFFKESK